MVTKSEFQNIYSCIKVSKNLRLNNQYVFNGKENFINFIKKLRNLLSNSDEKILYDIELSNEFGVLRLKSLDSLFKNINKYKSVYHLSITMIDTNNKKCHNAIEFSFQLFEGRNQRSYIKISSDEESWIERKENIVLNECLPRRNYLGLLFNPATEVLVYFIASFYVVINYAGQNTNQSPNMNLFNKLLAISDYKWKFTDVILVGGSIVIIQLIIMFIKSLFIPTFSIKKDANKSSVLYKFSVATKEPYNFITLMIGVIGIILSIILSVLK